MSGRPPYDDGPSELGRNLVVETPAISPGDHVILGDALGRAQVKAPSAGPGDVPPPDLGALEAPISSSPAMREVLEVAARVAASLVPVIIHGETGAGKEVVARFLHGRGPRAQQPMVSVNCAAIPTQLVESTLFGYERGAFTGAGQRQKGVFEEADGGTVFLDEIGELPLSAQAALLRVLETGRFARVGSPREIAVDVRVVAATHRDLEAMRDTGAFRADLYYRLSVMVISIPPLRDRPEDIEPLARRFLAQTAAGGVRDIAPSALERLRAYSWPGNVRELRNAVERAALLARDDTLREADLPARVREVKPALSSPPPHSNPPPHPDPPPHSNPPTSTLPPPRPDGDDAGIGDLRARLHDYEALILFETLEAAGWNQSEAARRLGMPIRTLSHKVKVLGLKKPSSL
jgi:DNA-binding NtrC family response regulator